jgi:hypothetical protein
VTLEVACKTAVAADPSECSLDNPSFSQHDEVVKVGSFDDLDPPLAGRGDGLRHVWSPIPGVGKYLFDERKTPSDAPQQFAGAVSILKAGWQNFHAEEEAKRVNEDVALDEPLLYLLAEQFALTLMFAPFFLLYI